MTNLFLSRRKKSETGFTLIELLAVIVILAVIATISVPIILDVIQDVREKSFQVSVDNVIGAVLQKCQRQKLDGEEITTSYNFEDGVANPSLEIQGDLFKIGTISVGEDCSISALISDGSYTATKTADSSVVTIASGQNIPTLYADASGANQPVLYSNMIPVYYDTDASSWIYADLYSEWYDYDSKEWANAVVLIASPSQEYSTGDSILMSDISQMYVWIPRFNYVIFNGNDSTVAVQEINVTFESETASTGTTTCVDAISGSSTSSETCTDATNGSIVDGTSTYTHPAFTFGSTDLTGFWFGKFEIGNVTSCSAANGSVGTGCDLTTLGIQVKPDVSSWRGARVSTFFTAIFNIASNYSINADTHMSKNMEWGAVAYLSKSQYGLGTTDIGTNNEYNGVTGCGIINNNSGSSSFTCNSYDTDNGQLASTTGNLYGIYDMSGGMSDLLMADMVFQDETVMSGETTYNSGFTGTLFNGSTSSAFVGVDMPSNKYYDLYSYTGTSNYNIYVSKLGDAMKEVQGWYSDGISTMYGYHPWIQRGGGVYVSAGNGLFYTYPSYGYANTSTTSRVSITESD
ncbi:MAG: type II secretion system protein [Bacilli bacterium]|nr:type II secretion system protein [Bacilli bacterium]